MGKAVRISMLVVFLGLVIMVLVVFKLYSRVFTPNVTLDTPHALFYIPTGSDFDFVLSELEEGGIIEDTKSFLWVASKKYYDINVKPGRYKIRNGLSNNELVNMLRAGNQDPVMVVFNNVRSLDLLAGKVTYIVKYYHHRILVACSQHVDQIVITKSVTNLISTRLYINIVILFRSYPLERF